jgi:hypothetical protein
MDTQPSSVFQFIYTSAYFLYFFDLCTAGNQNEVAIHLNCSDRARPSELPIFMKSGEPDTLITAVP